MSFTALISWSKKEFSELPWRKNRTLYRTLVSEIMLQQTTVGTVKNHYERFLSKYPTIKSLAEATDDELTIAWKGLGYYRRARNLKKIAEAIQFEYGGKFPKSLEKLMEIPGIGPYTANAIVGIGMDERALAVDANLERVLARIYGLKTAKGPKLQKEIQNLFGENKILKEKVSFRELNEALMDLGRNFCQARKATCEICPLKKNCHAFKSGTPLEFPFSEGEKKKASEHLLHLLRVVVRKNNKILAYKKTEQEWLSGQFEIPTFILSTTDKKLSQYPLIEKNVDSGINFSTAITKYKIKNTVLEIEEREFKKLSFPHKVLWLDLDDEKSNLTTATIKALKAIS